VCFVVSLMRSMCQLCATLVAAQAVHHVALGSMTVLPPVQCLGAVLYLFGGVAGTLSVLSVHACVEQATELAIFLAQGNLSGSFACVCDSLQRVVAASCHPFARACVPCRIIAGCISASVDPSFTYSYCPVAAGHQSPVAYDVLLLHDAFVSSCAGM
jgi:hypothetical protein